MANEKQEKVEIVESKAFKGFFENLSIDDDYYVLDQPKHEISKAIYEYSQTSGVSLRKLAEKAGLKHPQELTVTRKENYRIHTLLRLLHAADLELKIVPKEK